MAGRGFHFDRDYQIPREIVWRALTEPDLITSWLMETDFQAVQGHDFSLRTEPTRFWNGIVTGRVIEVREAEKLRYTWSGDGDMPQTIVSWELSDLGDGTRVRFSHAGFTGVKYRIISYFLQSGWKQMLDNGLPDTMSRLAATT